MSKQDNLTDFLTDVANHLRTKTQTVGTINPQNFSSVIDSIQTGGETYVKDLTASSSGMDVSSLSDGIYHGKRKVATTSNYQVIETYFLKQGTPVAFFVKNKNGGYRCTVNNNSLIYPNSSTWVFDTADYAIYKVSDMNWEVSV